MASQGKIYSSKVTNNGGNHNGGLGLALYHGKPRGAKKPQGQNGEVKVIKEGKTNGRDKDPNPK